LLMPSLILIFLSCSGDSQAGNSESNRVIPAVEAVKTRFGKLPLSQRLSGIVEARNQVGIYPEVSAVIEEVLVKDGDPVRKGQPLIRLRDKEFRERLKQAQAGLKIAAAQLKQAEARLNEISAELKRMETLAEQQLASPTELETVQTRAISAEADVELAKARLEQATATMEERSETLSQTIIRAPITGHVGNRRAEKGMLVSGNTRLFTIGELEKVRIKVVLTDRMLAYIENGQRAEIISGHSPDEFFEANISRISPFLNPVTHSTEAEIDLNNPGKVLKSGMFVSVDVFYGESEEATLVPLSALFENPTTGVTGVYVTDASLNREQTSDLKTGERSPLSDPLDFTFIPVEIVARGRMEAGVRGIENDKWVITMGQNLLGGENGSARVRPVQWMWVERLQNLQREDLMEELIKQQQRPLKDTLSLQPKSKTAE